MAARRLFRHRLGRRLRGHTHRAAVRGAVHLHRRALRHRLRRRDAGVRPARLVAEATGAVGPHRRGRPAQPCRLPRRQPLRAALGPVGRRDRADPGAAAAADRAGRLALAARAPDDAADARRGDRPGWRDPRRRASRRRRRHQCAQPGRRRLGAVVRHRRHAVPAPVLCRRRPALGGVHPFRRDRPRDAAARRRGRRLRHRLEPADRGDAALSRRARHRSARTRSCTCCCAAARRPA